MGLDFLTLNNNPKLVELVTTGVKSKPVWTVAFTLLYHVGLTKWDANGTVSHIAHLSNFGQIQQL